MHLRMLQPYVYGSVDTYYGAHYFPNLDSWRMRNKLLLFKPIDIHIYIGNRIFKGTPDLYKLIFMKYHRISPNRLASHIWDTYNQILIETNSHRCNYKPMIKIKNSKRDKYTKFIWPLFFATGNLSKVWKKVSACHLR